MFCHFPYHCPLLMHLLYENQGFFTGQKRVPNPKATQSLVTVFRIKTAVALKDCTFATFI